MNERNKNSQWLWSICLLVLSKVHVQANISSAFAFDGHIIDCDAGTFHSLTNDGGLRFHKMMGSGIQPLLAPSFAVRRRRWGAGSYFSEGLLMKNELPEHLRDKVASMPEYSYGLNRITVILDDGTRIPDVFVAWAKEIIKVGMSDKITFDISRIVEVQKQ